MLQQQQNLGRRFGTSKMHLSPQWLLLLSVLNPWFCCFDSFLIVTPIVGFCNHLDWEESAGCFALFVFLECCLALFHNAKDLSAVCDYDIS